MFLVLTKIQNNLKQQLIVSIFLHILTAKEDQKFLSTEAFLCITMRSFQTQIGKSAQLGHSVFLYNPNAITKQERYFGFLKEAVLRCNSACFAA